MSILFQNIFSVFACPWRGKLWESLIAPAPEWGPADHRQKVLAARKHNNGTTGRTKEITEDKNMNEMVPLAVDTQHV